MRFHTGTFHEQLAAKQPWRSWFAWYPVKAGGTWVWMETIERGEYSCDEHGGNYRYRLPANSAESRA